MNNQEAVYYKNLYQELSKKYSKEELVEGFVFPPDMTEEDKKQADKEIWEHRKKRLLNRTPEQKIFSNLLKMKYQIEDYVHNKLYDGQQTASSYLNEYMKIVERKQKELAQDIGIHPTRLSRILNGKEKLALAYRLEVHSGDLIPALLWWKLVQKDTEQKIKTDTLKKEIEKKNVRTIIYQGTTIGD